MTTAARRRSMWPKEHGAYAQLGVPLATTLVASKPTLAALAFGVAALAAFVAHEPCTILLGIRGSRARRENVRRAWIWAAGLGVTAAAAEVVALVAAPRMFPMASASVAGAMIAAVMLGARKERTVVGEILAASALAGAAAPVGVASGLSPAIVLTWWSVWALQFALSTIAVRAVISRSSTWPTIVATVIALVVALSVSRTMALALVPMSALCVGLSATAVSARSIRIVGVMLAVAMFVSGATLVVAS